MAVPEPWRRSLVPTHPDGPAQPMNTTDLQVNGEHHPVVGPGATTLLETLRDDLGLTGTKSVCEMGECGACTVLIDDRAVYSCLVLTAECEGHPVETIEGIADGPDLDPVQTAFIDNDAMQCGFCTPGQVLSLVALRRRNEAPRRPDVENALVGNLCRCGAYRNIMAAAEAAFGLDEATR